MDGVVSRRFQMNKSIALFLSAFMLMADVTWANVYRCVSDDGTVRYSDQPCAGNAELFIKEEGCNIDDSIRRAHPFKDLSAKSEDINDRLVSHAKKLGKCILPDETFKSYSVSEHSIRDLVRTWEVSVNYGDRDGQANWSLTFLYNTEFKDEDQRIRMTAILVKLKHLPHDLPLMENILSLNRLATGKYRVQLQ
jgi:Domain of unknown function (DUF4124)